MFFIGLGWELKFQFIGMQWDYAFGRQTGSAALRVLMRKKTKHGLNGGTHLDFPDLAKPNFSATRHGHSVASIAGTDKTRSLSSCVYFTNADFCQTDF
jgi:hypothetical protein